MEMTLSIGITAVVIFVTIVVVRKICNFYVTKKHEYEDEHRNIAQEFLQWMSKETKAIKPLINEDPDSKVECGYAIFFLYKKKIYCGIKHLEENKFKFVYKNFDELKENLMNDVSLQIKQYNITCKIKDLEKDFV